jgi:hypothetical protein
MIYKHKKSGQLMTIIRSFGKPPTVARCRLLKPIPYKKWGRTFYRDTAVCHLDNLEETNEKLKLF